MKCTRQVDPQRPLPLLLLEAEDERIRRRPRVVDEDIKPARPVNDALHSGTRPFRVGDVEASAGGHAIRGLHELDRLLRRGVVFEVVEDHFGAVRRQTQCDRPADPARPAGHERHLTLKHAAHRRPSLTRRAREHGRARRHRRPGAR